MVRRIVALTFAFAACTALSGEYYADAVNGDEAWDGSSNYADRDESIGKGPKKYLESALALATETSREADDGDTVYIAEGDYGEGSYLSGTVPCRGYVRNGCRVIGVGDKEKILVNGKGECRCLEMGKWTLVKNVTLCNGGYDDVDSKYVVAEGGTAVFHVDVEDA